MGRTFCVTTSSMVGIMGSAPAVDKKMFFLPAAMPVLFLVSSPKIVAPINVKFSTGERTEDLLPRAKFHVYRGRNVGIQPLKLSKFRILAINLPLRSHSFAQFLRNSQILYASVGIAFKF